MAMPPLYCRLPVLLAGLSLACAAPAEEPAAPEERDAALAVHALDAISVVGRGERRQVQRIAAEEAARHPPGSSPLRLLMQRPGVSLQSADPWASYEWSTRIRLRGFAQTQLGFTLDGVPLGDMSYANHSGLHISRALIAENLQALELAQGSASLDTPAAHALGGAVRMSSRAPAAERSLRLAQTLGSDATRRSYLRADSGEWGPLRLALSGVDHSTEKWKGWGDQDQHQLNLQFRLEYDALLLRGYAATSRRRETDYVDLSLSSQRRLGFDWSNYAPDWQRAIDAAQGRFRDGVTRLDDAYYLGRGLRDDDLTYLGLEWAPGHDLSLSMTGYYHRNEGQGQWITPYAQSPDVPLALRTTEYDIERSGLLPRLNWDLDLHNIEFGGWHEDNVHGLQRNLYALQRAFPPDAARFYRDPSQRLFRQRFDTRTRQWYLRDHWQVLPDRLELELGFKGSEVRIRARQLVGDRAAGQLRSRDSFQPQAAARLSIDERNEVFFAFSEHSAGFRPGIDGPFSTTQSAFDSFAADLRPERARLWEGGWRIAADAMESSLALYRVRFSDRLLGIARCSAIIGCPFGFANVGQVDTHGAEWALRLRASEQWDWYSSLSWNDSRYGDDYLDGELLVPTRDKQVVDSPRWLAATQLTWTDGPWQAGVAAKYTGRRFTSYSNDAEVPAYTLVDGHLSYRLPSAVDGVDLRLMLQLNNMFNRRYFATVGSNGFTAFDAEGLNYTLLAGPPRQVFVTLELSF